MEKFIPLFKSLIGGNEMGEKELEPDLMIFFY